MLSRRAACEEARGALETVLALERSCCRQSKWRIAARLQRGRCAAARRLCFFAGGAACDASLRAIAVAAALAGIAGAAPRRCRARAAAATSGRRVGAWARAITSGFSTRINSRTDHLASSRASDSIGPAGATSVGRLRHVHHAAAGRRRDGLTASGGGLACGAGSAALVRRASRGRHCPWRIAGAGLVLDGRCDASASSAGESSWRRCLRSVACSWIGRADGCRVGRASFRRRWVLRCSGSATAVATADVVIRESSCPRRPSRRRACAPWPARRRHPRSRRSRPLCVPAAVAEPLADGGRQAG